MTFAHIAGVPVEELLPAAGAGGTLVLARAWLWLRSAHPLQRRGRARGLPARSAGDQRERR